MTREFNIDGDLKEMLDFYHNQGKILYFGNLSKDKSDLHDVVILDPLLLADLFKQLTVGMVRASTRAPTRLGRVAEQIMSFRHSFRVTREKSVRIIVSWDMTTNLCVLTADIPGSVLGINPEGHEMPREMLIVAGQRGHI